MESQGQYLPYVVDQYAGTERLLDETPTGCQDRTWADCFPRVPRHIKHSRFRVMWGEALKELGSAHPRQGDISEQKMDWTPMLLRKPERFIRIGGLPDLVTVSVEDFAYEAAYDLVIVHNEYA